MVNETLLPVEVDDHSRLIYGNTALVAVESAKGHRFNTGRFVLRTSGSSLSLVYDENQLDAFQPPVLGTAGSYFVVDTSPSLNPANILDVVVVDYMKSIIGGAFVLNALTDIGLFQKLPSASSRGVAFSNVDEIRGHAGPRIFNHLVGYLRAFFKPTYGRGLANRVEELAQLLKEDYEGAVDISAMSLYYLIAFLEARPNVRRPTLAVSPRGHLIAQWREAENQRLSIHFSDKGSARAFLLVKNENHQEQIDRTDATSTADAIYERAGLANVQWIHA